MAHCLTGLRGCAGGGEKVMIETNAPGRPEGLCRLFSPAKGCNSATSGENRSPVLLLPGTTRCCMSFLPCPGRLLRHCLWMIMIGLGIGLAVVGEAAPVPRPTDPAPPRGQPAEEPAPAAVDAAEAQRLIRQLGSDAFEERQAATHRLDALGEPVLPTLRAALEDDDIEVRRRAGELIQRIERRLFGELATLLG